MGGPDGDALEWQALLSPRFARGLASLGVAHAASAEDADVVVVTGLLTARNLDAVLAELAGMPSPSILVAAGDSAINGGPWQKLKVPGLSRYALSHYADVQISVPGNPPSPQALIAALSAAAERLAQPLLPVGKWQE